MKFRLTWQLSLAVDPRNFPLVTIIVNKSKDSVAGQCNGPRRI